MRYAHNICIDLVLVRNIHYKQDHNHYPLYHTHVLRNLGDKRIDFQHLDMQNIRMQYSQYLPDLNRFGSPMNNFLHMWNSWLLSIALNTDIAHGTALRDLYKPRSHTN